MACRLFLLIVIVCSFARAEVPCDTRYSGIGWSARVWSALETGDSKALLERLSEDPELARLFSADSGTWEKYTVGAHTKIVLDLLNQQLPAYEKAGLKFPAGVRGPEALRMAVALHDIGKSIAAARGQAFMQHDFTLPILRSTMVKAGFHPEEISLAEALVDNDILGAAMRGALSQPAAWDELALYARRADLSPGDFFRLQSLFYSSDAGAYPTLKAALFSEEGQRLVPVEGFEGKMLAAAGSAWPPPALKVVSDAVSSASRQAWSPSHFTKPRNFDPHRNFRFLVHASQEPSFYQIYLNRRDLAPYGRMSSSIIDQNHTNTFSGLGLILEAPPESFFASHTVDMNSTGVRNADGKAISNLDHWEKLGALHSKFGLLAPEKILEGTAREPGSSTEAFNEIVLTGKAANGKVVKVAGLMIRTDSTGRPLAGEMLVRYATKLAKKNSLPIVMIPPSRGISAVMMKPAGAPFGPGSYKQVMATEKEFHRMEASAAKGGGHVIGYQPNSTAVYGSFRGHAFWRQRKAFETKERMEYFQKNAAGFREDGIRFLP